MICDQVQFPDSHPAQILPDRVQHTAGNPLPAVRFFHKKGTHIRRQIVSVVKVVLNHTGSGYNLPVFVLHDIPLRHALFARRTLPDALPVCLRRDIPFGAEPQSRAAGQLRMLPQAEQRHCRPLQSFLFPPRPSHGMLQFSGVFIHSFLYRRKSLPVIKRRSR